MRKWVTYSSADRTAFGMGLVDADPGGTLVLALHAQSPEALRSDERFILVPGLSPAVTVQGPVHHRKWVGQACLFFVEHQGDA